MGLSHLTDRVRCVMAKMDPNSSRLDALFHALSNSARRKVIGMLSERPLSIGEIAAHFQMSFEGVSKHVRILERAGVLEREIMGRSHLCRLRSSAMSEIMLWLEGYHKLLKVRSSRGSVRELSVKLHPGLRIP